MDLVFIPSTRSVRPEVTEDLESSTTSELSQVPMEYNSYREEVLRY